MIGIRGKLNVLRDIHCTQCELHKSSTNVCVGGRGNPHGRIVLIGEAPGEAEAETGKPFMGKSGQLLDQLLTEADLVGRVYILNTCKCRPPDNRTPTRSEQDVCSGLYLVNELDIIRPRSIVLLGRVATDWHFKGRPFVRHTVHRGGIIPTWHPSYVLRTGGRNARPGKELLQSLRIAKETAYADIHEPRTGNT